MTELDIDIWVSEITDKLKAEYGDRLRFVGIQGSRARGEATPESDIDTVVIIDDLSIADIEAYRTIVSTMPESELACGFIGSPDVLASWCRHDVFNLVMDTCPIFGSLDFMDIEFAKEDALLSAKVGASEIYHALCHTLAFDQKSLRQVLDACVKSSFFVMRSLQFAATGEYPSSRKRMKELASSEELVFLDAYDSGKTFDDHGLSERLLAWSSDIIQL